MPRIKSKAVPEGNGPVPHHDEFGFDEPTMADLYRMIKERFDRSDEKFDERTETMKATNQRLAGLQDGARQSCLAKEADVEPDTKTRKRTEGAAADRVKNGVSSSARFDDGPTSLTSFDMIVEPFFMAPENCVGDALVNEDVEAPKPHLLPMEVRMLPSAAGGLLPAGTASTAIRTTFLPTSLLRIFCLAKRRNSRTNFNQLAPPSWRKVIEMK